MEKLLVLEQLRKEKADLATRTGNKQKLKKRLLEEQDAEKALSKVGRTTAP